MSWTHSALHDVGVLPYWSCDSCTVMKDKSCHMINDIRSALSRAQVRTVAGAKTKPQFSAQKESFEPIFSQVERCCQWSGIHQQENSDAA